MERARGMVEGVDRAMAMARARAIEGVGAGHVRNGLRLVSQSPQRYMGIPLLLDTPIMRYSRPSAISPPNLIIGERAYLIGTVPA